MLWAGACSTMRGVMSGLCSSGVCGLQLLHPLRGDAGAAVPPLVQWLPHVDRGVRVRAASGPSLGAAEGQVAVTHSSYSPSVRKMKLCFLFVLRFPLLCPLCFHWSWSFLPTLFSFLSLRFTVSPVLSYLQRKLFVLELFHHLCDFQRPRLKNIYTYLTLALLCVSGWFWGNLWAKAASARW